MSPNPLVGCVVVRAGRVVGEGSHARFGGPHAEAAALARAGRRARGATLYVNLEPCGHWGKTPPCAEAVVRAGIARVVAAGTDPHRLVGGRGLGFLRRQGVKVETGVLEDEAQHLNRAFLRAHGRGRPYVIWKTAQTLDGKIASRTGASRWITGPRARTFGHRLRAQSDAVLVGGNTVRRDNPTLSSHGQGPDPLRLVVSRSLDLPTRSRVFQGEIPTWVLTGPDAPSSRQKQLEKRGVKILKYSLKDRFINLMNSMNNLFKSNVVQILLEGGGNLSFQMAAAGLIDEVYAFLAPGFLGGSSAPTALEGLGWPHPAQGPRLRDVVLSRVGEDILVHGFVQN